MTTRDELLKLADELDGAPNLELLELIGALRRRDAAAALRAYRAGAGPTEEQVKLAIWDVFWPGRSMSKAKHLNLELYDDAARAVMALYAAPVAAEQAREADTLSADSKREP